MNRMTALSLGTAGAAALAMMVSGCAAPPAPATTAAPIVLSIGTDDSPGVPAADEIQEFARQVTKLSDGSITIEPRWHAAGDVKNWDQAVAGMVVDGDIDLAVVPSRAWGDLGATSLEVLGAPFLIQSDELVDEVLSGDIADDLMATLPDAGAVGIGMFPEGLRHPFGFQGELGGPADYRGKIVRAATSGDAAALYTALGATTTDDEPDIAKHVGTDSSFVLNPYGTAAGNVTFYPKVNVLVAGSDSWAKLTKIQRELLEKAAVNTLTWSKTNVPDEAAAAKAFCAQGGKIAAVSAEDLAALQAATAPLTARIAALPGNAEIIAAITALRDAAPAPTPIVSCDGATSPATTEAGALNGSYRYEITPQDWADAGVTDAGLIGGSSGKYAVEVEDGTWTYHQTDVPDGKDYFGHGTYAVAGDAVTFTFSDGYVLNFTFTRNAAGDITLTPAPGMGVEDATVMASQPWIKVG